MFQYALRRWDEPHLFDALSTFFVFSEGNPAGERYGTVTVCGSGYDYFFKTSTDLLIFARGFGSYTMLEDAALAYYNDVVDEYRSEAAEEIAAYDPAFGGRPHCTVL